MELKLMQVDFPKVIEFNFEELKEEITAKSALYKNMVYSDESIKEAKADKAKLNKFIEALETERKKVKRQCLDPYEAFERKIQELVSIVNEPVKLINECVRDYDERRKQEKEAKIREIFMEEGQAANGAINLMDFFDPKWLNVSVSLKKIQEEIHAYIEKFNSDIKTIESLPIFAFEAKEHYMRTHDLAASISEGQRLADIQKRKEIAAQAKKEADERSRAETLAKSEAKETVASVAVGIQKQEPLPTKQPPQWIGFKALLTVEQAIELKLFFDERNIQFQEN